MEREQPAQYVCDACGRTFDTEADLDAHVRRVGIVD